MSTKRKKQKGSDKTARDDEVEEREASTRGRLGARKSYIVTSDSGNEDYAGEGKDEDGSREDDNYEEVDEAENFESGDEKHGQYIAMSVGTKKPWLQEKREE